MRHSLPWAVPVGVLVVLLQVLAVAAVPVPVVLEEEEVLVA